MESCQGHFWECRAPSHSLQRFDTESGYQEHLQGIHDISQEDAAIISAGASQSTRKALFKCPFQDGFNSSGRAWFDDIIAYYSLRKHIKTHLEDIALLALQNIVPVAYETAKAPIVDSYDVSASSSSKNDMLDILESNRNILRTSTKGSEPLRNWKPHQDRDELSTSKSLRQKPLINESAKSIKKRGNYTRTPETPKRRRVPSPLSAKEGEMTIVGQGRSRHLSKNAKIRSKPQPHDLAVAESRGLYGNKRNERPQGSSATLDKPNKDPFEELMEAEKSHMPVPEPPHQTQDDFITRSSDIGGGQSGSQSIRSKPKFPREAYTVGWICSFGVEYTALIALDEEHMNPEGIPDYGSNGYKMGRIHTHNVVIAPSGFGEYGRYGGEHDVIPTLRDVENMLRAFPNISIRLVVGIGGGMPSPRHDIRLGDVVVSDMASYYGESAPNPDIYSYDIFSEPKSLLRTALDKIRGKYAAEGPQIEEKIRPLLRRTPWFQHLQHRPGPASDRLYKATVRHPIGGLSCAEACGDDPSKLVNRRERTRKDYKSAVHYGDIIVINEPIKDAFLREQLAAKSNALSYMMGEDTLTGILPCVVIQGICDYSDSHRNERWQGYAAMAAAVYARDLICLLPSGQAKVERRADEESSAG
ncbi:ankyrin repeat domain-containing protein [Arthroderma uncinatum]|uniref:ankyrin repeat domain-containing protein n=1 Tax=Arthroderma uncinatum TaxID=74035 RepID=UPI00144A5941|nr:ankyrin repeat domain-containing protein [Arthroderma uncinatum]KAF3480192.1 ankyrin repeat domain-containing protein [Arthroderma uncinatum]